MATSTDQGRPPNSRCLILDGGRNAALQACPGPYSFAPAGVMPLHPIRAYVLGVPSRSVGDRPGGSAYEP
jgi:hypothetical protein